MKRSIFKKVCAVLMAAVLSVSLCPMDVLSLPVSSESDNPEVYYSDLFYGYDTSYLLDATILKTHIKQTSNILADIYNDFAESSQIYWSIFKTGFNMSIDAMFKLDVREYAALMSDTYGNTNYIYNSALDNANKLFAKELIKPEYASMAGRASDEFGIAAKFVKRTNSFLKLYDEIQNNYDPNEVSKVYAFNLLFDWLKNEGFFYYIGESHIDEIEDIVLADVEKYTKIAGKAVTVLEAFESIFFSIMLEDIRMEIVSDLVASAPKDSCLYDGMVRLKNQLSAGFVSYFAHNYLKDEVLDFLLEQVTKPLIKSAWDGYTIKDIMGAALSVASWVIFDVIFKVPNLEDVTIQKVLADYSSDLYDLVKVRSADFATQFNSSDIATFESVFDAYIAATNAALELSQPMALDSNRSELENITSDWKDFCYSQYIKSVTDDIKSVPFAERKVKFFENWENPCETFKAASNTVEENTIYLFNGALNANVRFTTSSTIISENNIPINIKGNVNLTGDYKTITITIPSGAGVTIDGTLTVGGNYNKTTFVNNGTLTCLGNVTFRHDKTEFYSRYTPSAESRLILKSNLTFEKYNGYSAADGISQGTIEFAGTEQQEVELPRAYNVVVTNPKGIKYLTSLSLYGRYDLNGNPLERNGYVTYLCGNNSELDSSDFQEVRITEDYTLDYDIKGNVNLTSDYKTITITIPSGADVTIDGTLTVGGNYNKTTFVNNGTLTCLGNVTFRHDKTEFYSRYTPSAESRLILKSNLTFEKYNGYSAADGISQGTIEFAGTGKQEAQLPVASIVEISNTSAEGVVFTTKISVSKFFDHKGNNFTLYNNGSGSTFVDYDGDGLLDHVDPNPTVYDCKGHVYDNDRDADCNECGAVREVIQYLSGDANGDGVVNNKDLGLLQRYINGWGVAIDELAADVTGDGTINNKDLGLLQRYINGWGIELA